MNDDEINQALKEHFDKNDQSIKDLRLAVSRINELSIKIDELRIEVMVNDRIVKKMLVDNDFINR